MGAPGARARAQARSPPRAWYNFGSVPGWGGQRRTRTAKAKRIISRASGAFRVNRTGGISLPPALATRHGDARAEANRSERANVTRVKKASEVACGSAGARDEKIVVACVFFGSPLHALPPRRRKESVCTLMLPGLVARRASCEQPRRRTRQLVMSWAGGSYSTCCMQLGPGATDRAS
jgi:hypothetical protein